MNLQEVANWLLTCNEVVKAEPVKVSIGKDQYDGVLYTNERIRIKQDREVTEGRAKEGDKYYEPRIYILGEIPKKYLKGNWAFTMNGDDWYTICYSDKYTPVQASYHPFGHSWILGKWHVYTEGYYKGWTIDTGEKYPYKRLPMEITQSPLKEIKKAIAETKKVAKR